MIPKYYVSRKGRSLGPFSMDAILTLLRSHQLGIEDLATEEGCQEWKAIGDLIDLSQLAPPQQASRVKQKSSYGCAIALIVSGVCLIAFVFLISFAPKLAELPPDPRGDAWYAAKQFVERSLKSPSTAKFPRYSDDDSGAAKAAGENQWKAWGFVDSQNGFGAMIRSEWKAVVEKDGERWKLIYLRLGDERMGDVEAWNKKAIPPVTPE